MDQPEVEELRAAAAGLLYPSETDTPLEAFSWGKLSRVPTPDDVRRLTGHAPDAPIEEVGLAEFFEPVTTERDWYGEKEKATTAKYRSLAGVLKQMLEDIRVYRVGETEVDAYIVGRTKDGEWAGLKTRLVET